MYKNNTKTNKAIQVLFIIAGLSLCAVMFYVHREFYNDDAYISLRYAQNLINGNGLVWNIGQKVEGYTNFLHVVFTSLIGLTGISLVTASRLVNVLGYAFMNLSIAYFLYKKLVYDRQFEKNKSIPGDDIAPALAVLVICMNISPLISWIYGGLEGPLFTSFVTAGAIFTLIAIRESRFRKTVVLASMFLVLAGLTRPDGMIFWAGTLGFLLIHARLKNQPLGQRLLYYIIPPAIIYLPYFIWHYSYYHDLLPLTYYLKATGFTLDKALRGLNYIYSYIIVPPYVFIALIIMLLVALIKKIINAAVVYLVAMIGLYMLYIAYIGGDYMFSFRHMLPMIPIAVIATYLIAEKFFKRPSQVKLILIYAGVITLLLLQLNHRPTGPRPMVDEDKVATAVGRYINTAWPKGSLVALNTAGATPYYAPNHNFIDMLGLNDVHIAKREIKKITIEWQKIPGHSKGDGKYVLSREPDYIILGPARGTISKLPWFLSDHEICGDRRFYEYYRLRQIDFDFFLFSYYERIK